MSRDRGETQRGGGGGVLVVAVAVMLLLERCAWKELMWDSGADGGGGGAVRFGVEWRLGVPLLECGSTEIDNATGGGAARRFGVVGRAT